MKKIFLKPMQTASVIVLMLLTSLSQATLLTGGLNVDNHYKAYISTSDNVQGTFLSSATNWPATQALGTANLLAGQDYYLHIFASNITGPAGFLGDFTLTGSDHLFANNSSFLTTNVNDWLVSATGWSNYGAVTSKGTNGVTPWGNRTGVDSSATWIWLNSVSNYQEAYFTTKISATSSVSEPSMFMLLSAGLMFLGLRRKFRK